MTTESNAMDKAISLLMQKSLAYFAGSDFRSEVETAKREFFMPLSIPEESSPKFEIRMSQFYDWYFFTRQLSGFRQTPLNSLSLTRDLRFTPEEEALIEILRNHRHSLFEFVKIRSDSITVRDLFKAEKVVVPAAHFSFEDRASEIFEARIVGQENQLVFMRGFCFHPEQSRKFILAEIKRHRKDPDLDRADFMLNVLKMNIRMDQYKHVPLDKVYTYDSPQRA